MTLASMPIVGSQRLGEILVSMGAVPQATVMYCKVSCLGSHHNFLWVSLMGEEIKFTKTHFQESLIVRSRNQTQSTILRTDIIVMQTHIQHALRHP